MVIRFWGTRGSIPVSGADYVKYGGDTSCVSVEIEGKLIVVDAGTGIRRLGMSELVSKYDEIYLVFSHCHLDHIRGLPFFAPLYDPQTTIYILTDDNRLPLHPMELIDGVLFPREMAELPSTVVTVDSSIESTFAAIGIDVATIEANHPGGAVGFDFRGERRFIHMPDNELGSAKDLAHFADLFRGADVLAHDAQYTKREYDRFVDWGHSSVEDVVSVATKADVSELILFHHDPDRTDKELDRIVFDLQSQNLGTLNISAAATDRVVELV